MNPAGPDSSRPPSSSLPGAVLALILLALAVLAWPHVLVRCVPLQWRIGNVSSYAALVSLALGLGAFVSWLARRGISSRLRKSFPSRRHVLYAALAAVLAMALFGGAAEVALRAFHIPFQVGWTPMEYRISRFDPVLGWSYLPNLSTVQRFGAQGRRVAIYTGPDGYRVASPGASADAAAPTLIFAGCSYTFGHGLLYEETFAGRVAELPGNPLQVINLGVQGYGTDQSLLSLKEMMPQLNVKAVVYTFLLDHVKRNDNADRRFIFPKARFAGTKPRFELSPDGSLHMTGPPRRYDDMIDCHVCDLVQLFWTRWGPEPSVPLTQALVKAMKEYVESRGAVFVLVLWTNPHRMPPGQLEEALFPGLHAHVVDVGSGAPPDFAQWMIPGETHPDARAHAYVAGRVADELERLGLMPLPSGSAPSASR
jgi:uncharacterized membrane protein (DUF441 family)